TGATIRVENSNALTNDNVFVNAGTVTVVGGRFVNTGNFTNSLGKVVTLASGVGTFNAEAYNAGTWILNSSTNQITGKSTVTSTGTRSLTGSVDNVSAGDLSIDAGGVYGLFNGSSITANGQYTNAGSTTLRSSWGFFFFNAINSGAYVSDASTSFISLGLTNTAAGSMIFSNGSQVSVVGNASSAGRMAFISSVGTFSGSVLNDGVWTLNPSTNNIAGNLTVAAT